MLHIHHQTRESDMFITQDAHNRWYVVLNWTGANDDRAFATKEQAEQRMRELKAGR